jgi:hypothetical protein
MTIHGDVQKLKESKDFKPARLIRRGTIYFPPQSPSYSFDQKKEEKNAVAFFANSSSNGKEEKKKGSAVAETKMGVSPFLKGEGIVVIKSLMTFLNGAFPMYISKGDFRFSKTKKSHVDADDYSEQKEVAVFTLDEIAEKVIVSMEKAFACSERVLKVVLLTDHRQWVTPRKKATQAKRATHSDPYPEGSKLTANGISLPFENKAGLSPEKGIQVQRLMQTRFLREDLFKAIQTRIIKNAERLLFDEEKSIVLDLLHEPPIEITLEKVKEEEDEGNLDIERGVNIKKREECYWKIGEDDCAIPRWCIFYGQEYQCLVQTIDRDLDVILTLNHKKIKKYLVLDFEDGRYECIHENAEALEKEGWTLEMYAAACCLAGTDFVNKSDLTYFISVISIFQAAFILSSTNRLKSVHLLEKDLELLLRMVYTLKLDPKSKKIMSVSEIRHKCSTKKKLDWPDPSGFGRGFESLQWNLFYWQLNPGPQAPGLV